MSSTSDELLGEEQPLEGEHQVPGLMQAVFPNKDKYGSPLTSSYPNGWLLLLPLQ